MTTIAFDGKTMAGDTLYVQAGVIDLGRYLKMFTPAEGEVWTVNGEPVAVFGFAGDVTSPDLIKEKLVVGLNLTTKATDNPLRFDAIIVTKKGDCYYWLMGWDQENKVVNNLYPQSGPFAIGSGGKFALGVMAVKGDALAAVKASSALDPHTGGNITLWSIDTPETITSVDQAELA